MYDEDDDIINWQCYNEEESNNEVHDNRITYTPCMEICTELFNYLKGNIQLIKYGYWIEFGSNGNNYFKKTFKINIDRLMN